MKKTFIFIFTIVGAAMMSAQTSGQLPSYNANTADGGVSDAFYKYALGSISDANEKTSYKDENIEGSPYKQNAFVQTTVFYEDDNLGKVYYRYNAFNEEVEIKARNSEEEPILGLGKDKKIKVMVENRPMSFKTFIDKSGNTKNGYLTLVQDGTYKLYKRLHINFKEVKKAPNTFVKGKPARFIQSTEYYLESEDGLKIAFLELNKKKLLKLVDGEKQSTLKSFLKEQNIDLKEEKDLNKVIQFLNT